MVWNDGDTKDVHEYEQASLNINFEVIFWILQATHLKWKCHREEKIF
jgi:hypothetical protein